MIRGPDVQSDRFLQDLRRIENRMSTAQRQLSSGLRIMRVSDAPDELSDLLAARTELGAMEQTKANLNLVKTEVDTAEQALGHAVDAVDRALMLGAQGATDIATADSRATLAGEVSAILQQLVSLAGASVSGRYIFSGDGDQTPPYDLDLSISDSISTYRGAPSTRVVVHPSGQRFLIAHTASDIFDAADPAKNVFKAVNSLRLALQANDAPAIGLALANVRSASIHLNNEQSFYGAVQNQVAEGLDFAEAQRLRLTTRLASIEEADLTAAILEVKSAETAQQAALAAESRRPHTSLFDYLR